MIERPLVCHPATPAPWIDGIVVKLALDRRDGLTLVYTVSGDLTRLRLPVVATVNRVDGLWRHTCCEAFVMGVQAPAYREYNFAPSGAWQAYDFEAYRRGGRLAQIGSPRIARHATAHRLTLSVRLAPADLPDGSTLRLALSTVLEDGSGQLSYWALTHTAAQPDFHHPDAFILELDMIV